MHSWEREDVGDNDLVLIEVHVVRSKCDTEGRLMSRGTWDVYRVDLELQTVCMIWKCPPS